MYQAHVDNVLKDDVRIVHEDKCLQIKKNIGVSYKVKFVEMLIVNQKIKVI